MLLSLRRGCRPNRLEVHYELVFGEELHIQKFGYTSIMTMAGDMLDVIYIDQQQCNGVILYGVTDESTKHIGDSIAKQKYNRYCHSKKHNAPYNLTNILSDVSILNM